jgi:hypothetical protein
MPADEGIGSNVVQEPSDALTRGRGDTAKQRASNKMRTAPLFPTMGTNNTLINIKNKRFCQEILTKIYSMCYSLSQETLTKSFEDILLLKSYVELPTRFTLMVERVQYN